MDIVTDPAELQARCLAARANGARLGIVPTMGYFHAGHLSLMEHARENADLVVVSLFVNPTQFAPTEDLASYPRDFDRDLQAADAAGADILFAPPPEAMYAPDAATMVEVPSLAGTLCGRSRPTHFRGVATVVAKLFNLAQPHLAVFGQKDWQQLAVIRRLARDLNFPVEIVGRPIVREADGLAMSSRNVNLSPEERSQAPAIYQGLSALRDRVGAGRRDAAALLDGLLGVFADRVPTASLDYAEIVHPESLAPLARLDGPALCAVALRFSRARLIDNILVDPGSDAAREALS